MGKTDKLTKTKYMARNHRDFMRHYAHKRKDFQLMTQNLLIHQLAVSEVILKNQLQILKLLDKNNQQNLETISTFDVQINMASIERTYLREIPDAPELIDYFKN